MNASAAAKIAKLAALERVDPVVEQPLVLPVSVPASGGAVAASCVLPESGAGAASIAASVDASVDASVPASAGAGVHSSGVPGGSTVQPYGHVVFEAVAPLLQS